MAEQEGRPEVLGYLIIYKQNQVGFLLYWRVYIAALVIWI